MTELTLKEIHEETLAVMDRFHALCEELGIDYYMAYGTLIGAVRHKGFIPWDDDFDVLMKRNDYEKLMAYCLEHGDKLLPYKLCCRANTQNYYYGLGRFSDTSFPYEPIGVEKPVQIGVFIDVYPLDDVPVDKTKAEKVFRGCRIRNRMFSAYINPDGRNLKLKLVRPLIYFYTHLVHGRHWEKTADREIASYIGAKVTEGDTCYGIPAWSLQKRLFVYPKKYFQKKVLMEFEGRHYYAPEGWQEMLEQDYGDFMQLPPEEARHTHHSYRICRRVFD